MSLSLNQSTVVFAAVIVIDDVAAVVAVVVVLDVIVTLVAVRLEIYNYAKNRKRQSMFFPCTYF